jgi:L-iditol 2-dehydrogenase
MQAAVLYDVGRMAVRDVPRPEPAPGEVVVRPTAVGLCGTDFHIFEGHGNYHTDARGRRVPLTEHPQILGHEVAGIVESLGAGVTDLRPGDRVIIDQGRSCAGLATRCLYCAGGDSHQCEHYAEHGITGLPGGLAEAMAVPAANAISAGPGLSDAEAALTEPLACIMHAMSAARGAANRFALGGALRARVDTVLVTGAGPAGLLFVQYLRRVLGYDGRLLVSDPDPGKRALAARFGADALDPAAAPIVEQVLERTGGDRAEWLVEASGSSRVLVDTPGLLRKRGTLLLYGHGHTGVDVSVISNIQFLEPTIVTPAGASGGFDADGRPAIYRQALRLLEEGRIEVRPFLTHRYRSLRSVPEAFAGAHRAPGYIKGVVELSAR